uniref:Galectin n=1 Tax=Meloidogyne hapla TaxID=6305 RepID=A0A1I8B2B7_MELHA
MGGWKFNKLEEPYYKLSKNLTIGQLFNLDILINQKEFKIHYGIVQEMYYPHQLPSWTIQYIKVDSNALSLPPRGHYVKIERVIDE